MRKKKLLIISGAMILIMFLYFSNLKNIKLEDRSTSVNKVEVFENNGDNKIKEFEIKTENNREIIKRLQKVKTFKDSTDDSPTNIKKYILLKIYSEFSAVQIHETYIYIYEKNGKYFIESPYNGIYKINKKEYNRLLQLINES